MTTTAALAKQIILEWIVPIIGTILSNLQYLAPVKDLQTAVVRGSLHSLNPTPWAFMMGKCLGWTGYGILTKNWFALASECPGFLIACWLNLGAVKLLYASHHKEQTVRSLVSYLATEKDPSYSKRASSSTASSKPPSRAVPVLDERTIPSSSSCRPMTKPTTDESSETDSEEEEIDDAEAQKTTPHGEGSNSQQQQQQTLLREWGEIVWNVTSQKTPAKAPHERLVMAMIVAWVIIFGAIGLYGHYHKDSPMLSLGSTSMETAPTKSNLEVAAMVVGFCSNLNQIFFYGAPLSRIVTVLKTRNSDTLHFPTMLFNTLNAGLWFVWAFFAINDVFIYFPSGLGLCFGIAQFVLWTVFPKSARYQALQRRSGGTDEETERPTLSLLVSSRFLATVLPEKEDNDNNDRTRVESSKTSCDESSSSSSSSSLGSEGLESTHGDFQDIDLELDRAKEDLRGTSC